MRSLLVDVAFIQGSIGSFCDIEHFLALCKASGVSQSCWVSEGTGTSRQTVGTGGDLRPIVREEQINSSMLLIPPHGYSHILPLHMLMDIQVHVSPPTSVPCFQENTSVISSSSSVP